MEGAPIEVFRSRKFSCLLTASPCQTGWDSDNARECEGLCNGRGRRMAKRISVLYRLSEVISQHYDAKTSQENRLP